MIYVPKKLSNPEEFSKKKEELEHIFEDSRKAILRLLVKIKTPLIIKAVNE